MPALTTSGSLSLVTRKGTEIENWFDRSDLIVGKIALANAYRNKYVEAFHRSTDPSGVYNCHGLTFASRRTGISKASMVRQILSDDDFLKIEYGKVEPGDIVIYVATSGDIEHSGIVTKVEKLEGIRTPWVLSKWGEAHEVVHRVGDCPYQETTKEFYRIIK